VDIEIGGEGIVRGAQRHAVAALEISISLTVRTRFDNQWRPFGPAIAEY
jgi:hypothetical protein